MPRSTALPTVVATLVLAVAAHPLSAQQTLYESAAATAEVAGVEFPMVVDTFDVIRIRAAPVAGLGLIASYATPLQTRADFTLYVFSNGDTVEEEFASATEQLSTYLETQEDSLTTFTLDERGPTEVRGTDGTPYAGYRAVGTYDREGERRRTWLYVFEKDGQLVKHRATTPEADVEVIAPRVEAFVAETLGELDATAAAVEPEGLLWEQGHGPMRIADLHLPLVADGFAALEVERDVRRPRLFRATYRSQSRTAPVLNVVAHARRDTSLTRVFAQAYGPLRMGAEERGMEFEEDELLVCEWRVPGDETVTGFSGGVRLQGTNDTRHVQVIANNAHPWSVIFTLAHPPGQEIEHRYPPILSEILARITSEGAGGRVDAEPELRAAPEGVIG